jgi:hypothetical protein
MLPTYRMIRLADVRVGMVVSDDVLDAKGHVLLTQGVVITDAILAALARHDIDGVPILQAPSAPAPAPPALDTAAVQARLDYLFRSHAGDATDATDAMDDAAEADRATRILRNHIEDYRLQREVGA